ncbi:MAG: UDP-N-acetylmuramoyl-tripeptide--D-alanyl-D-alanine ligase [Moraxellaceae bacterium]|nr:UDP-N-acetylmuramoyl-tripeptide--D-alanyl-D-alanine ligase [Pseudobdellovibrionaceae bacterium]
MKWTLEQVAKWTNGKNLSIFQTDFTEVGTDTRQNLKNKIFIALKGDQYDAHDFLDQAVAAGAGLLLVHRLDAKFEPLKKQTSIILVDDTLLALQNFSREYRHTLATKFLAITGSNGKTTTKEYTAAILNEFKPTHFNQGSFNNHWGVPLTLLQTPPDAAFAVIEMGMNHAGEITRLVQIADPDYVACTMVGRAHIEFFESIQKIAEAKREIYLDSKESTVRIFNQDQDLTFDMMYPTAKKYPASRMLSFSEKNKDADVYFKIKTTTQAGLSIYGQIGTVQGIAEIPIFGDHNLVNLMTAATLAYSVGMPPEKIWHSLRKCHSSWGRNQFIKGKNEVDILFDGYNANPDSMNALIKNVASLETKGRKIAVIGQMREMGVQAEILHEELGYQVGLQKFDHVFFIGENDKSFETGLKKAGFKNYQIDKDLTPSMKEVFLNYVKPHDFVLIKGSRGIKTERFVDLCNPLNWASKYN